MRTLLAAALLMTALAAAPAASAIYIESALPVSFDKPSAQPGDELNLTIQPANETSRQAYAGRTLRLVYHWSTGERSSEAATDIGDVTLDDKATATFRWTVPAEVDDANVDVTVMDGDEAVGYGHIGIGDAPPMLMAATGGPIDETPADDGAVDDGSAGELPADDGAGDATTNEHETTDAKAESKDVPFLSAIVVALFLVGAAVAFRRG